MTEFLADPQLRLIALAAIGFVGAIVFGLTGFGAALVTIPLAGHFVSLPFALALFSVMDLANAMRIGFENPRNAVRAEWVRLVPMIVVGTALGVTLLVNLPRRAGMLALGAFVIGFALLSLLRGEPRRAIGRGWAWVAGLVGGVTSTVFGAGGPPYAMYLSRRALSKEQFRATLGFATLTSISIRVVAFLLTGLFADPQIWLAMVAVIPAGWLGISLARRLFQRVSRAALMRIVALLLLASGGSLVLRALA